MLHEGNRSAGLTHRYRALAKGPEKATPWSGSKRTFLTDGPIPPRLLVRFRQPYRWQSQFWAINKSHLARRVECPLLAQSGHHAAEFQCLLLGVKRTLTGLTHSGHE